MNSSRCRRIVLVHGLWDDPSIFDRLRNLFPSGHLEVFTPHLQHFGGYISLKQLALDLDSLILQRFGNDSEIDLLGFSMGGIVSRIWLQEMGGALRTNKFLSVGAPHCGTFTAQLFPFWLLPGIAEMKRGSYLIQKLKNDISTLKFVRCSSFYCRWDLMVFPGWDAVLPIGKHYSVPVLTHKALISHPISLNILTSEIFNNQLSSP